MADVLDQSQTIDEAGNNTIRYSDSLNVKVGQSFIPSVTAELSKVIFKNKRLSSPTGNIWCELYDDSGGEPNTQLAVSSTIDVSTIATSNTEYTYTFSGANRVELTSGNTYYILLAGDWTYSTSVGVQLSASSNADPYEDGCLTQDWGAGGYHLYPGTYDTYFKQYYDDTTLVGGSTYTSILPAFRRPE